MSDSTPSQQNFCPSCGQPRDADAVFCAKCGKQFKDGQSVTTTITTNAPQSDSSGPQQAKPRHFKVRLILAMVLGLLMLGWIFVSPYVVAWQVQRAADTNDIDALKAHVDFPQLRESLKEAAQEEISNKQRQAAPADRATADMQALFANGLVGVFVDGILTPNTFARIVRGEKLDAAALGLGVDTPSSDSSTANASRRHPETSMRYETLNKFVVHVRNIAEMEGRVDLIFTRSGLGWKLTGMRPVSEQPSAVASAEHTGADNDAPKRTDSVPTETWNAMDHASMTIFGDFQVSPTKLVIRNQEFPLTLVREFDKEHVVLKAGDTSLHPLSARLYKTLIPQSARFDDVAICDSEDTNWMYVVYEERDNDMHVSFLCGKSEPDLQQVEVGKGSWYRLQTQADVDSMLDETEREVKEYEALTDLEKTRLAKEGEEERKDQTNRGIGRATSKDDFDRMIVQLKLAGRVKEENGKLTWLK